MKSKFSTFLIAFFFLSQFVFSQNIETIGVGAFDISNSTLTFTDLGNIDHVVVEATFKATALGIIPNGPVTFSDSDESYNVVAVPVENLFTWNGLDNGASPHYFKATFNTVDASGISLAQLNNLGAIHSFIAYVYRNVENGFVSTVNMDHAFFFWNGPASPGTYTFPLDIVTDPRVLKVTVPISEMSIPPDTRKCIITVTAGGVSQTVTIMNPDPALGTALNLVSFTLVDVPGNATELTVSIYSPSTPYNSGDSFISSGVVIDVETTVTYPQEFCTLTQGFYGNYGGIFNGQTTSELLWDLLSSDLYLGAPGHSLTLTQADVDCVIARLPGGGPSNILNGDATCSNAIGITIKKGRFHNSLLAQAITLGLNLRLSSDLGSLLLSDIDNLIGAGIIQELGSGATVNDFFDLVNDALGGVSVNIGLGDLTNGMGNINDFFDECASLSQKSGTTFVDPVITSDSYIKAYPNPIVSGSTIEFEVAVQGNTVVELINIQGQVVKQIYNGATEPGSKYSVSINASDLNTGIYILKMTNGSEIMNQKISIVR